MDKLRPAKPKAMVRESFLERARKANSPKPQTPRVVKRKRTWGNNCPRAIELAQANSKHDHHLVGRSFRSGATFQFSLGMFIIFET